MNFSQVCSKIIKLSFHALFFLIPLVLCPLNFELFEYNKMMLTYTICIIICTAWVLKMLFEKRFYIRRTPLDIPILLFVISQIISTVFSIDPHTSLFGYYSRFHGGLLSSFCYIFLYYALVSNVSESLKVISLLKTILFSGALVAIYGILQHPNPLFEENGVWHGIDHKYWVQDVELRVFSTIGQPNWLAAYLAMLIPIATAFLLMEKPLHKKSSFLSLASCFYLCLLFTNSRAGAGGFLLSFFVFLLLFFLQYLTSRPTIVPSGVRKERKLAVFSKQNLIFLTILILTFGILTSISGKFLIKRFAEFLAPKAAASTILPGETVRIRNIVWKGAIEIFKHYPLFGSGVETFAYSYYQFRPKEHNQTTEWDFLYNKAHNEYLNFLATTGIVGLLTYLLIIFTFGWWFIKYWIRINPNLNTPNSSASILILGLFSGYISYLIQNFYSFSVVPIATFFFLFPGITFLLAGKLPITRCQVPIVGRSTIRYPLITVIIFASCFSLFTLGKMWLADTYFAKAHKLAQARYFEPSYLYALKATSYNPREPLYFDQLAYNAAVLATEAEEATTAAILAQEAISASQRALTTSPLNINLWKTAIKVLYQLGSLNQEFYQKALEAAKIAIELSPTEPKLPYNLGLIYLRLGDREKAVEAFKKAIDLKPDLRDPHYALAVVHYEQAVEDSKIVKQEFLQKALVELEYIINNIDPGDIEAQEKLREWYNQPR